MIPRSRRPLAPTMANRAKAERPMRRQATALEEFWNALADDTERMSNEELRAELALLKLWEPRDFN